MEVGNSSHRAGLLFALLVLLPVLAVAHDTTKGDPAKPAAPNADDLPINVPNLPFNTSNLPFDPENLPYNPQRFLNARQTLNCHKLWGGPSAKNDVLQCLTNVERAKGQIRDMALPIANAVLLVLILVLFPIIFLFALCCTKCCAPDSRHNAETARCCMWMWIIYALLWAVGVFVMVMFGAKLLMASAPKLIDDALEGPVHYFNTTAENILDFMSDWSTGERKPRPQFSVDITPFTTAQDEVRGVLDKARKTFFKHLDTVSIVSYAVGSLGFVLMLLIIPFACFRCCIPCFPMYISCVYWFFAILFAVLGVALNAASFTFSAACGEVSLQYERQPGVFQWYVVPYCKTLFDFEKVNEMVREAQEKHSQEACTKLLQYCDNTETNFTLPKFNSNTFAITAEVPSNVNLVGVSGLSGISGTGGIGGTPSAPGGVPSAGGTPSGTPPLPKLPGGLGTGGLPGGLGAGGLPGGLGAGGLPEGIDVAKLSEALAADGLPAGLDPNKLPAGFTDGLPKDFDLKKLAAALPGGLESLKGLTANFKPLLCGANITNKSECTDFGTMSYILLATKIKQITQACPEKDKSCSIVECAYGCKVPQIAAVAVQILEGAMMARNASVALSYARPMLEWNFLIDKMAASLETCNDFRMGTVMLGLGFFLGSLMFVLGIYIMLRGACIWGRYPKKRVQYPLSK